MAFPSIGICLSFRRSDIDSTQPMKHRPNSSGRIAAKTRLRVSWDGIPLSSGNRRAILDHFGIEFRTTFRGER